MPGRKCRKAKRAVTRVPQPKGCKGSLLWIQRAVNEKWASLESPVLSHLSGARTISWKSPLAEDEFAEYRDGGFLRTLGLPELELRLAEFWPQKGPQWDALGLSDRGDVLLVEAKAHVAEMCSPGTSAKGGSRARIEQRLQILAKRLKAAEHRAAWTDHFYQIANRLAHLQFLRDQGVPAFLIFVNFLNDDDMEGPAHVETWEAAYHVAFHTMGLRKRHALSNFIIEVFPDLEPYRLP